MEEALVSVIVPALNAATYIRQTLDSVLEQTYRKIEVIVVDDGSSDSTAEIVEEFVVRDPRFQLVRQSNAGVGAARNTAIKKARGKYLAPLDADDLWSPQKLETQVACMERSGINTGLVYCSSTLIDEQGKVLHSGEIKTLEGRLRHAMVLKNLLGNASVPLFRTSALEKVGLYLTRAEEQGGQGCEDWDLALRIAENFDIRVVPEHLVGYRQCASAMSVNVGGMEASFANVMRRARQRNGDLPPAAFRWSAGYFYQYIAEKCYESHHYPSCIRYLTRAIAANPVLVLNPRIYKTGTKSLLSLMPGPMEKNGTGTDALAKIGRKRPFKLGATFRHLELARWSAALEDGACR
ncbi:MAG: glycosyltransferase family 2 protein [Verrucomicrobia bacterium]|nr:glycosyltransferase family 2 protein [Verrucomicrobiota bacterium]MBV8486358.1 glycosyltransferase family 2 protein [Verrucomicrobiota bacterium]